MKNFRTVFHFEFLSLIRKKSFIITTFIFVLILFGASFLPTIIGFFSGGSDAPAQVLPEGIVIETDAFSEALFPAPQYKIYSSEAELEAALSAEEISAGYLISGLHSYGMYFQDVPMSEPPFIGAFEKMRENVILGELGIDAAAYRQIASQSIESDMTIFGSDSFGNFPITYVFIFVFYFLVIFYGNTISTSVAREKSDRTMELLITSTDTQSLLFGKVLGAGLAGILQFLLFLGAGLLGYLLNKDSFGIDISRFLQIGTSELIYFIVFTLVGYFLYLFLFAAFGSSVSKIEDVATSTTPITLILVAAYMIAAFSMSTPNSTVFRVASYFPFSSPMIMPARNNMMSLPQSSVLISLGILLITSFLLGALASKIYRLGTLNYGNKLTLKRIIQSFKS